MTIYRVQVGFCHRLASDGHILLICKWSNLTEMVFMWSPFKLIYMKNATHRKMDMVYFFSKKKTYQQPAIEKWTCWSELFRNTSFPTIAEIISNRLNCICEYPVLYWTLTRNKSSHNEIESNDRRAVWFVSNHSGSPQVFVITCIYNVTYFITLNWTLSPVEEKIPV
jgi:hypothetical protein